MYKVSLLLICAVIFVSCVPSRSHKAAPSYVEVSGDQATRVARITTQLAQNGSLPTALRDAHFVEEKIGDDVLGPADYRTFILLEIAPEEVPRWLAMLAPLQQTPAYAKPGQTYEWWVDPARFEALQFYEPMPLTQRIHGWIAVDAARGHLYLYTFTT